MQALRTLLPRGLYRHWADIATARSFQQAGGIGAVGLVAPDVGAYMLRRQQLHRVAQPHEVPRPRMRRAAGLHDNAQRCAIDQALRKRTTLEPPALDDTSCRIGKCQFKNVLGQVHRQGNGNRRFITCEFGGSVHVRLLA